MTLRFDLRINQGETFQLSIPVRDTSDNPVDVTGMDARGQIRAQDAAPAVLYEWSDDAGNLVLSTSNVVLLVPAADSTGWTFRTAQYDVELVDPGSSATTRLVEGLVIVHPEITRDQ